MYDSQKPHPLLAQVPLTVNPFISLPKATTLPYTYKTLPTTLPPSVIVDGSGTGTGTGNSNSNSNGKAKYVVSASGGHAAHPDEILGSCRALEAHLKKTRDDAERTIRQWEDGIRERELAEKRRLAPGYLDREEKILEPTRFPSSSHAHVAGAGAGAAARPESESQSESTTNLMDSTDKGAKGLLLLPASMTPSREGEELDRAFGGMGLK